MPGVSFVEKRIALGLQKQARPVDVFRDIHFQVVHFPIWAGVDIGPPTEAFLDPILRAVFLQPEEQGAPIPPGVDFTSQALIWLDGNLLIERYAAYPVGFLNPQCAFSGVSVRFIQRLDKPRSTEGSEVPAVRNAVLQVVIRFLGLEL